MGDKSTALTAEHKKLGAKLASFAGFEMPIQYNSVKEEVIAVRSKAGVFDVSHMGEFFVEGPDAVKFIDYMLTNDFTNAGDNKAVYSPLCRENGTVIDDLIAYKLESKKILICVNASNIDKDYNWFKKHISKFNCELSNHSEDYSLLALQGPDSESILRSLNILPDGDFPYYSVKRIDIDKEHLIIARTGYTGEDGFELFCSHGYIKTLWENLLAKDVAPCGLAARDVLRLEVCYPLYGHEIHDEVTPLDSALKWTVKLTKENFIGKSALAEYKPKFRLIKLAIPKGIPREGYSITNDKEEVIGKITSGTMSVTANMGIALGHIEKSKMPENKRLFIQIRKNNVEAEIYKKAFISGGHK